MSPRRQATADPPGQVGEPQDDGRAGSSKTEQESDRPQGARSEPTGSAGAVVALVGAEEAATALRRRKARRARSRLKDGVPAGAAGVVAPDVGQSSRAKEPLPTRVPANRRTAASPSDDSDGPGPGSPGHPAESVAVGQLALPDLSARLTALARMIEIGASRGGRGGFSKKLLTDAEAVLGRAGERMRLSPSHTVVALAGGTGSGKSSIFNRLAGADLSTVGVTRPVTREAHACIWASNGSEALVDWLGIPARHRYSRTSELDRGEDDLAGMVLVDLPDHDSVMSHSGDLVDRLVSKADVLVWVLDPQKYADEAVHRRFLVPMADHADVVAVVLNQSDLLDAAQIEDCVMDLRRLLDTEDLPDVPILVTSAVTGAGIDELRTLLSEAVAARVAASVRISADVDGVVSRFAAYAGDAAAPAGAVPAGAADRVAAKFERAAGVLAVLDALRSARELRAADFVGWPVAWVVLRLAGRGPLRKERLGLLWNDMRAVTAGPAGAQQAEIDNAITEFGDAVAASLPKPWANTVRSAARSRADEIPAAVGSAIGEALPAEDSVPWSWRIAGLWQGLLLGVAAVTIAWMALITVFGVLHAAAAPALFTNTMLLPWIAACAVAALGLGAATSRACVALVRQATERESVRVAFGISERIAAVTGEMVTMPVEQELSEYQLFRAEIKIAEHGAVTHAAT